MRTDCELLQSIDVPNPAPGHAGRWTRTTWLGLYWAAWLRGLTPSSRLQGVYRALSFPYSVSVDDKHQMVWANDFNSRRIFSIDMKTGNRTEYFMPVSVRDARPGDRRER